MSSGKTKRRHSFSVQNLGAVCFLFGDTATTTSDLDLESKPATESSSSSASNGSELLSLLGTDLGFAGFNNFKSFIGFTKRTQIDVPSDFIIPVNCFPCPACKPQALDNIGRRSSQSCFHVSSQPSETSGRSSLPSYTLRASTVRSCALI